MSAASFKNKAEELLSDKQRHKRWLAAFLLLALLVSLSTVALLTERSIAMTGREVVFSCPLAAHRHGPECCDADGNLCCEYAVSHVHNERCCDADGNLICTLPEIEPHVHDGSCFERQTVLVCGLEESRGHVHDESCWSRMRGELICENTDEDHVHDESCYEWTEELTCGQRESEGHTHDESCYDAILVQTCTLPVLPEHVHTDACFTVIEHPDEEAPEELSDPDADVEYPADWERAIAALELSGERNEDVLSVAMSQLGYRESERNFELSDGVKNGYTRYGAWYGAPYGDWCAMFVSFCLHYAGIPAEQMPYEASCTRWIDALTELELYREITPEAAEPYTPQAGDLVFFRFACDEGADHVGLVAELDEQTNELLTVEGNSEDCVQMQRYAPDDARIVGYAVLPEKPSEEPVVLEQYYVAADGSAYTVTLRCGPEAGIPAEAELVVREPDEAEVEAYLTQTAAALDREGEALNAMCLLDISIMLNGEELQPQSPVSVTIRPEGVRMQDDPQVVHFGEETEVVDSQLVDGEICFDADGFSIYVIVGETIEQRVLASDGKSYYIRVTCEPDAGIPENAALSVEEITEDSPLWAGYVAMSESALGLEEGSATYVRLFDIKIVDAAGQKVEIAAPVDVSIELADRQTVSGLPEDTQVVHFADGAPAGEVVSSATVEGETVSFAADGFSAYAIVAGPDPVDTDWRKIESMADFAAFSGSGVYIGNVGGYYFTNELKGNNSRMGIKKTTQSNVPNAAAAIYYFEPVDGSQDRYYAYCLDNNGQRQYVRNNNNNSLNFDSGANKTAFTVTYDGDGVFRVNNGSWYWNMQGGVPGERFCSWNSANDVNNNLSFWIPPDMGSDPYGLSGRALGLMNFSNSVTGKGLMAASSSPGALDALPMTVLTKYDDQGDYLFMPSDSDLSLWTFQWIEEDLYALSAATDDGVKYLMIDSEGIYLSDTPCRIRVFPGTGIHENQICLKSEQGTALTYSGTIANGFWVGGTVGSEWLNLVQLSEISSEYLRTYTADMVSIAQDQEDFTQSQVTNGSEVIIYTRIWDDTAKRYKFYAVDYDGSLVPVYESGNTIQWIGDQNNTLLWRFVEYYSNGQPNYYYELQNEFSDMYIAPQVTGGQTLSPNTIGINLNGRRNGYYYSTILAWDDENYAYAGLKVQNGRVVSCPLAEAQDFYFAEIQPPRMDDSLTTVPTVDNAVYGITMKMIDFNGEKMRGNGADTTVLQHTVLGESVYRPTDVSHLLNNRLGDDGYPTASLTGRSLEELFGDAVPVNHLFLESILSGTGYFEYDSTQNFATLQSDGNFVVYQELGTHDGGSKNTLLHGQFFPYNDLEPGVFATTNGRNLYTATAQPLPTGDPRYNERLYRIIKPGTTATDADHFEQDYFFGVQLEASFVQTPSGLDNWGHDIIYEFTGDDDFWLYVDDELVIDLGGIHSALPGSVNYATGDVVINKTRTTLYQIFKNNYIARNPDKTAEEVDAYLAGIFKKNSDGKWVFHDYTYHKMTIFYMERGAGASNLHMRFNLSSVKEGTVLLSKELDGVDDTESVAAEFPYQIFYKLPKDDAIEERLLDNNTDIHVVYKDTITPVPFRDVLTVDGIDYYNVFMLRPGEIAEISFPDETISYRIVECGINTGVYDNVSVRINEGIPTTVTETPIGADHADYGIDFETTKNRPRVTYTNRISPDALRILTITKILYDVDGTTLLTGEEGVTFSFRLYIGTEYDAGMTLANMYTYHVKNEDGEYCRWDAAQQKFVSLGAGKTDYTQLTRAEKESASFTTSMNGSISKIPAFYTVEVRELLAGTRFKVEERDYEIPDGYSRVRYVVHYGTSQTPGAEPVVGVMPSGDAPDPHAEVINKKGYGLRIRKLWTDAEFMAEREATYFAIFLDDSPTPIPNTVRQIPQSGDLTQYWYFNELLPGTTFDQYHIREVKLTAPIVVYPTSVDPESGQTVTGVVGSYGSLTRIDDGETLTLDGRQHDESTSSAYTYTVTYRETFDEVNVRQFAATNDRPGVILRKTDWNGNPLAGAEFTLYCGDIAVGTFTSDDTGYITTAFLRTGVEYRLVENKAPVGCMSLDDDVTITLNADQSLTVGGVDPEYFVVTPAPVGGSPTLAVKNRSFFLRFVKEEAGTGVPLEGAQFSLHREKIIGGVLSVDLNVPIPGYESLVTDSAGVIPRLDNSLPAGTYYLKEITPKPGFALMSRSLRFTISDLGTVTIRDPDRVGWLSTSIDAAGSQIFTVTVPNERQPIVLQKVGYNNVHPDDGDYPVSGARFTIWQEDGITPVSIDGVDQVDLTDAGDGIFFNDVLLPGTYYLEETVAPPGYQLLPGRIRLIVDDDGRISLLKTWISGDPLNSVGTVTGTDLTGYTATIRNVAGYTLPATGGSGTLPLYAAGAALLALAAGFLLLRRRRRTE